MSFAGDVRRFARKVETDTQTVFVATCASAKNSWVEGSPVTGAPPIPRDTGNLANSVQLEFPSATEGKISTNVDYADDVELNLRGVTFRNGGPHGLALTIAGLPAIVDDETRKLTGGPP
jgi:hypothetical protein